MEHFFRITPPLLTVAAFAVWLIWDPSYVPILTLVAIVVHEFGHLTAAAILKVPLGGFRMASCEARLALSGRLLSYGEEFVISFAGPLFNLFSLIIFQLWGGHILGEGAVSFFVTVSAALALLNLLPISDFDGGRILHCLLAPAIGLRVTGRVCELLSILSLFCLWCMSVYALIRAGGSLSLFVFSTTLFVRFFIHGPRS